MLARLFSTIRRLVSPDPTYIKAGEELAKLIRTEAERLNDHLFESFSVAGFENIDPIETTTIVVPDGDPITLKLVKDTFFFKINATVHLLPNRGSDDEARETRMRLHGYLDPSCSIGWHWAEEIGA